jgi:hypothetical protein
MCPEFIVVTEILQGDQSDMVTKQSLTLAKSRLNPSSRQVMKVTTTPLLALYQQT